MEKFKFIGQIPPEADLNVGDEVMVRKGSDGDYRWQSYKVAANGSLYPSSITQEEWEKLDNMSDNDITKLKGLNTQSQIDAKIDTIGSNAAGSIIEVPTNLVLPRGSSIPTYITTKGKATLRGGDTTSNTYTNANGSGGTIVVSAGSVRDGFYDKTTDTWTAGLEQKLPSVPVANDYGTSITSAISQRKASETNTKIDSITKTSTIPIITAISRVLLAGAYRPDNGVLETSNNQISTDKKAIPAGVDYLRIEGYGSNTTARNNRYLFWNNNTYLGYLGSGTATGPFDLTPMAGATHFAVHVDGGAGIAIDLPNSPYQQSFKMYAVFPAGSSTVVDTTKIIDPIESEQILGIEEQLAGIDNSNKYFNGVGYPPYDLGNNQDKYLDTDSLRLYIKQNNDWGYGYFMGGEYSESYPDDFTFKPFDINRQSNGYYAPKWKGLFNEKVKADYDRLTKYYVDPVNGSDSNNGLTRATAVKTISNAITTKGGRNIELMSCPGFYPRTSNFGNFTDIVTNDPLIIRGVGNVAFAQSDKGTLFTWTSVGNGVYSTPRTESKNVFDTSKRDSRGCYFALTKVTSLEDCQAIQDSWYTNGTLLYVHRSGGITPASNSIEVAIGLTLFNRYNPSANVPYIYMENLQFYTNSSSDAISIYNNTTTQYNFSVYLKNVQGNNNKLGNGIAIDNAINIITEGCTGWGNLRDAHNYHTSKLSSGYIPSKVIEISAVGGDSGVGSSETSSNGSTTHEGITILRLNGKFEKCMGSVIADVNNGALSCNFGIIANDTILANDTGFRINGTGSKAWYFGCYSKSSLAGTYSITANAGSTAYKDLLTRTPNGTAGNVIDY